MNKKIIILSFLATALTIAIGIGISYAYWGQREQQENPNIVQTGCFKIELEETVDSTINMEAAYPMYDEDGEKLAPYIFKVTNTCTVYANYSVNLERLNTTTIDTSLIKVQINNEEPKLYSAYQSATKILEDATESRTLATGGVGPEESVTYNLRLWIDSTAGNETQRQTFASKIVITAVAGVEPIYAAKYIENLVEENPDTMVIDEYGNTRYIGTNPQNYVKFNGESWRIIGVFKTYECPESATARDYDTKCSEQKLLKLIRADSIGNYSWDSSLSSVNSGYGVNEWRLADLNTLLNDYYYNSKENQTCYNSNNNGHTTCSFNTTGIKEENHDMIANVLWYTGTIDGDWSQSSTRDSVEKAGAKAFYEGERSDKTGKICQDGSYCNDSESRSTKWIGKVGLMYPSDYGYSIGNDQREACLAKSLYSYSSCASSSWLFMSGTYQWTITPVPYGSYANAAFYVHSSGRVSDTYADIAFAVRPVVYLKSNVSIVGDGTGESGEAAYQLSA